MRGLAARSGPGAATGLAFLSAFGLVAAGVGAARAVTTTYVPVLLDRIEHAPALIGVVMLVNAAAGFLVPLAVGLWSDRAHEGRTGRRLPFVIGGTALTCGGLIAVALGTGSSYAFLALAAAATYVGLNATATAHRAIVVESFEDERRPAATSAQEIAMLVGGLAGLVVGGALIGPSPSMLFVVVALTLPLLAAPTLVAIMRRLKPVATSSADAQGERPPTARDFLHAVRERGPREVLLAQILWVLGYAALPAFFILYADRVLEAGAGRASLLLAGFGVLTGAAMVVAGRARSERVYPLLRLGVLLLGGGLLGAGAADSLAAALLPFGAAAVGAGLVTALGFPYFARLVPKGQSGRYSGLYFSVRAIASAIALPLAGVLIEATGSYRTLMWQGGVALAALVPLAIAESRQRGARRAREYAAPRSVGAVIPCFASERAASVVAATAGHVDRVVLVDDGSPAAEANDLRELERLDGVEVLRLERNSGKGDAVAAGVARLAEPDGLPDAVIVLDADGQHPPERIPDFVAASSAADVVVGNRRADRTAMPRTRRATNSIASGLLGLVTGSRLPDSQCGMRLYRREALERVPAPAGRYEAETVHLRALLRDGAAAAWVPIPAIYDGESSSFRPLADSARVLWSILRPWRRRERRAVRPSRAFAREWAVRLSALVACTWAAAALMPLVAPLDERLFVAVNSLGAGPEWIYQALDPHSRNYVLLSLVAVTAALLSRRRAVAGVAAAVLLAAFFSDVLVQLVYLLYDRPRPEEVLGSQALLTDGRSWAHIASFPSGHMVVTTAIAVAGMSIVPALRGPLWAYVGAIALTRITFGAHFPLDVLVGAVFGYEVGRFSAAFVNAYGMVPGGVSSPSPMARWWERAAPRLARVWSAIRA